ncbi:MAG: ADP-ribosylglycohydrolase family protein [Bacteroidetes bacterium]|nr:MAG: ADP-ribosylglycohydrolase family protein [Bacteroidota bacterium]
MAMLACNNSKDRFANPFEKGQLITLKKSILKDKIMSGWAGQLIGCTYGGTTEFQWNGTMIGDQVTIPWDEYQMEFWYDNSPGLYDDVYMDLTFVQVFEEHGLDASAELHVLAFAHAGYPLWHANQAARYNILQGIMPPAAGNWKNNPHADDIDLQIEADFSGLMSPGMINASSEIANKINICIYGDFTETSVMPTNFLRRKTDIYWNYNLPEAEHEIKLVLRDLPPGYQVNITALIVYSDTDSGPQTYF